MLVTVKISTTLGGGGTFNFHVLPVDTTNAIWKAPAFTESFLSLSSCFLCWEEQVQCLKYILNFCNGATFATVTGAVLLYPR
jgi:hypothetical protein